MSSVPEVPSVTLSGDNFSCTCKARARMPPGAEGGEVAIAFVAKHAGCPPLPQYAEPSTVYDAFSEAPNDDQPEGADAEVTAC